MRDSLTQSEIEQFITQGYVCIPNAFPTSLAASATEILWNDIPFEHNPDSWTEPVVRLGMYTQQPFVDSVNTPVLHHAFNQLVGIHKWIPCRSVGTFPVRFPSPKLPMDTGKHVDASFPGDDPANYFEWRVNITSKGRALLMLVLYSDVTDDDAPTLLYKESHADVARLLEPEGDRGLSFMNLAHQLDKLPQREAVAATGKAGTVYLCHPFMVHGAQPHRGHTPRFMAQPPLLLRGELTIRGTDANLSPVEKAIQLALHK